jgi:hypothetical protein
MSLREEVLNAIPDAAREGVLKMALDHNIVDPNDPTWAMVALAWAATQSAGTSKQTLADLQQVAKSIPDEVFRSVQNAGNDLAAGVADAIDARVVEAGGALFQSIEIAINRGAAAYDAATQGLDKMAADKGATFINQWKAEVAKAVHAQAEAALKKAIGVRWGAVAVSLAAALVVGAVIGTLISQTTTPTLAEVGARIVGRQVVFTGARGALWCHPGMLCVKPRGFAPPKIFGISVP